MMEGFFENGTSQQFEFVLSKYRQALQDKADAKNRKSDDLVQLDNWFQKDLPKKIKSRSPEAHLTHEELVQTITWKLARGKFRPRLKALVTSNPAQMVIRESKKSIKNLLETNDLEASIHSMCTLKGVGPALASAVLAAAAPEKAPFMADECLLSIPGIENIIDYTMKAYMKYVEKIGECVMRLNLQSKGAAWTPHRVELALWTHYVASDLKLDFLADMPPRRPGMNGRDFRLVTETAEDKVTQEMDRVEVTRIDGSLVPVKLAVGEHFLGRGPLLQITDTKISRNHAKIDISDKGDVELTALHANPCYIREEGGQWTILEKPHSWLIKKNLEMKFTENLWHFKFSVLAAKSNGENMDAEHNSDVKPVEVETDPDKSTAIEPKGVYYAREILMQPSKNIDTTMEPESSKSIHTKSKDENMGAEHKSGDKPAIVERGLDQHTAIEPKGIYYARKVLMKPSKPTDTTMEPELTKSIDTSTEPFKPTEIEPEPTKPTVTKSRKKRKLPDWLLKLTADNGIYPLLSSPKKRKHDFEDDETSANLKQSPKNPKRPKQDTKNQVKASPAIASSKKSPASTATDSPPKPSSTEDFPGGASNISLIGTSEDSTDNVTSKDYTKVTTPVKKPTDKDSDDGISSTAFPVLVTAEDLQDSDDEIEKENKVKQKNEKKKVKQPSRPSCSHGASCYRKNPTHFRDEAHPGDPDFKDTDDVESDDERPECEFGTDCYRKNPDHKRNFKHSHKPRPKRAAKANNKKKAKDDDDLDDSFLDDDSEESIDDTDNDEDYEPELNSSQD